MMIWLRSECFHRGIFSRCAIVAAFRDVTGSVIHLAATFPYYLQAFRIDPCLYYLGRFSCAAYRDSVAVMRITINNLLYAVHYIYMAYKN